MTSIDTFRDEIRNLETSVFDPYSYESHKEKATRELRRNSRAVCSALESGVFTPGEVLTIAEITPDYVSLSADGDIIASLRLWIENNRGKENTTEIRLYTDEAEKMLSSLCI